MAKKQDTAAEQKQGKKRVRIPRSVAKHIRRLKSEGRESEAEALQREAAERKKQAGKDE